MLLSQFSAIFAHFWRKNGVFLKKQQCNDPNFAKLAEFLIKTPYFSAKIFKNHNIGPRFSTLWRSTT
jgi:hypothetical protein